MDPTERRILIGERLGGRYEVIDWVGGGAFAGVFRAADSATGEEVAAKVLSFQSGPDERLEFDGERQLLEALRECSNVVGIRDAGVHTLQLQKAALAVPLPVPYLVLELADASLAQLLLHRASLAWSDRLLVYRGAAKGVHQMHRRRFVHRDSKADNVLVFGNPVDAKVGDLGRSRDTQAAARFAPVAYVQGRGDLRFAPPELLWGLGEDDPRLMAQGDLYMLGSLLFEVATGVGLTSIVFGNPLALAQGLRGVPPDVRRRCHPRPRERPAPAGRPAPSAPHPSADSLVAGLGDRPEGAPSPARSQPGLSPLASGSLRPRDGKARNSRRSPLYELREPPHRVPCPGGDLPPRGHC